MNTYTKKHIDMTDDIVTLCGIDSLENHINYSTICDTLTGNSHTYVSDNKLTLIDVDHFVEVSAGGVVYYMFDVTHTHRLDIPETEQLLAVEDVNIAVICRHVDTNNTNTTSHEGAWLHPQRGVIEAKIDTIEYGQTTIYKR